MLSSTNNSFCIPLIYIKQLQINVHAFFNSHIVFSMYMLTPLIYSLSDSWFPTHLLPRVVTAPSLAGNLTGSWHSIPVGVIVGVALGDMQCSIMAAGPSSTDTGKHQLCLNSSVSRANTGIYFFICSTEYWNCQSASGYQEHPPLLSTIIGARSALLQ